MVSGGDLARHVANHLHHNVELQRIVLALPKLGLKSRKTLLNLCQTEQDVYQSRTFESDLKDIIADYKTRTLENHPTYPQLEAITSMVSEKLVHRSFLAMMVRCEVLDSLQEQKKL